MATLSAPILAGLSILAILLVWAVLYVLWRTALLAAAYKAKVLASSIFVAQRQPEAVLAEDLAVDNLALLKYVQTQIDWQAQTVTASVFGVAQRQVICRPGLGCTLVVDVPAGKIQQQSNPLATCSRSHKVFEFPIAAEPPHRVDEAQLAAVVESAFAEADPKRQQRSRALIVVQAGQIIAERYAPGFTAETPLLGWSMTKSVVNALVGILVQQGKLSLDTCGLVAECNEAGDRCEAITIDQLLRMSSGLPFSEIYSNPLSNVTKMLFSRGDMAAYAANRTLAEVPGAHWSYASGTTNILCRIIRQVVGSTEAAYFAFPHQRLFEPLGMTSAVLEPDASGTFVGSSYMYATARDWAKFGQLYLQDGVWDGERILPEGWVDYSRTPAPAAPQQQYGAHFWLKVPHSYASKRSPKPQMPADTFMACGYQGQILTLIPSLDLVVGRFGLSQLRGSWDHEWFIQQLVAAVSASAE
ncbi:serine hydrolase [Sphaerothrix gracilis]|uniref:serine hydrolase domain-containing protein n=1 Tax=Sphaerothrix gracilis TaxID=3151835 RepID=UPI0031FD9151